MRTTLSRYCEICKSFHEAEILSWDDQGYPEQVRDLELCPETVAILTPPSEELQT